MYLKQIYILIFALASIFVFAQTKIDSLVHILEGRLNDSVRLRVNTNLSEICNENDIAKYADVAIKIGEKMLTKQDLTSDKKNSILKLLSLAYNNSGYYHRIKGHTTFAIDLYLRSLTIREMIKDTFGLTESMSNIATIYNSQGRVAKALVYYNKALNLLQLSNNKANKAACLNNIANVYNEQSQQFKALDFWEQSLTIYNELQNINGQILVLNNIGSVYVGLNQTEKGLIYLNKSAGIAEKSGSTKEFALGLENIGKVYLQKKEFKLAIDFLKRALLIREKIDDRIGISSSYSSIANAYFLLKNYKMAENYGLKSLKMCQESGYAYLTMVVSNLLYKTYKNQSESAKSLKMHEIYTSIRDSINNIATKSASIKSELQYVFDKKFIADSIKNVSERKIANTKLALQNAKIKQQNTLRYALIMGIILTSIFLIFFYSRFRVTRSQKNIIQAQSLITEKQNRELEVKNKNITESILMAKEIQHIIFPSAEELSKTFSQCFMLFKPYEILSGDFLWLKTIEQKTFLILGDCAGHGVPGSLLTVFANEFLNKIIVQKKIHKPAEILSLVNEEIYNHLKRKTQNAKALNEGMDIGICLIDKQNKQFVFSGARINLYYSDEKNIVTKINGDKIYLGKELLSPETFKEHQYPIEKINSIYLTSDGLLDQLKYKSNKSKYGFMGYENFIIQNVQLTLNEQLNALQTIYNDITTKHAQIDDILVFACKIV